MIFMRRFGKEVLSLQAFFEKFDFSKKIAKWLLSDFLFNIM
jgi:hypothetical protein